MKLHLPITLIIFALMVTSVFGGDGLQIKRMMYEDAIDNEIVQSRQMATLLKSRSATLRKKGHREASMAMYLETHRDELVVEMMESNLEPKAYKVERFLDERFNCSCYATWASR